VGLHLYAVGLRGLAMSAARRARGQEDVAHQAADLLKAAATLRDQAPLPPCQDLYDLCALEYADCVAETDADAWEELARRLAEAGRCGLVPYLWLRAAAARLAEDGRRAAEPPLREAWRLLEPLGETPLGREVAALAHSCRVDLAGSRVPEPRAPSPFGLTPRETEVLKLVCDGATNRQIARTLTISERTAGVHVSNILGKLHARNRAEAIAIAHRSSAVATSS
jgi:DNA-binding CsgD family transcriptional regulator